MKMFIDGRWTDSSDGAVSSVINPATGVCVDTVPEATEQDVDRAIALAVEGQKEWNDIPLHEKLSILERYCVLLTENTEKIASIMCEEGGKPIEQCRTEVAANAAILPPEKYCCRHHAVQTPPDIFSAGSQGQTPKQAQKMSRSYVRFE